MVNVSTILGHELPRINIVSGCLGQCFCMMLRFEMGKSVKLSLLIYAGIVQSTGVNRTPPPPPTATAAATEKNEIYPLLAYHLT